MAAPNAHGHDHEHGHEHGHDHPMTVEEAVRSLLLLGQTALGGDDFESAAEAYRSVLALEQNEAALCGLASLHARGLGVRRDFMEAARLFHQAELMGNAMAGALCRKCMYDFMHEGIAFKTPTDLYAAMGVFVSRVYPEADDKRQEVANGLTAIASTLQSKGELEAAEKVAQALEEFAG